MNKDKIQSIELGTIIYAILRTASLGISMNILVSISKQNSYLSIILGSIIGIIAFILYQKLLNYNENMNIVELIQKTYGKTLGFILNTLLTIFVLSITVIVFWNIGDFVYSQFLNKTPQLFISFFLMIPVIYILLKGLRVIGRTNMFLFYINIIDILFITSMLIPKINLLNFKPFLNEGVTPVFKGGIYYILYNILPIFLLLIIPKKNIINKEKYKKHSIVFYIITNIALFIAMLFLIGISDVRLASLQSYPEYHVLETITLSGYIRRFESILSITWLFSFFTLIVISIYFVINSIKITFKIESQKKENVLIIIITTLCMLVSNYIFKNNTVSENFLRNIYPYLLFSFLFILPLITYIIAKIRKIN